MAKRGWNGEAWTGGFGRGFGDDPQGDRLAGDELPWDDWDEEGEFTGDDFTGDDFTGHDPTGHDLTGMGPMDVLSEHDFLNDVAGVASPGQTWNWAAPVNVDPDGRIFRKTRFPVLLGGPPEAEWMWVQVQSLEDRSGILANQPLLVPGLMVGDVVRFEVIPEGRPLAGCSEAVAW